jgi:sugar phosphate isomerase/epimerase
VKLAVSNIAWPREHDAAVAELLREHGITGVEVAPTKLWPKPLEATDPEVVAYRRWWEERGFRVVAAQSLLFGRPDLTVFESHEIGKRTLEYLAGIVRLCSRLGAEALVFGSPKNRRVGTMPREQAAAVAVGFFRVLGTKAATAGTAVVMEANPPEYGADFVTRAVEAVELVSAVKHRGFRLHLDTGCMSLANDPIPETFDAAFPLLRHFHVSEPNLAAPGSSGKVDHPAFAAELRRRGYEHWVSLEMREPEPFNLDALAAAVRRFTGWYAA